MISSAKAAIEAIVKVSHVNNKLLLYSAGHPDIPTNVILTDSLKSISIYYSADRYVIRFNYMRLTEAERIVMPYKLEDCVWEDETKMVINEIVRLV